MVLVCWRLGRKKSMEGLGEDVEICWQLKKAMPIIFLPNPCGSQYFAILTLTTYEEYEAEVWDLKHFCPKLFDNLSFWDIRFVLRHFFHHMFHKASVSGSKQCGRCGRDVAANGWSQRLGDSAGSIDGDFCGGAPGTADLDPKKYPFGKGETSTIYKKNTNVWRSEEFCVELAVVFVKFFFRKRSCIKIIWPFEKNKIWWDHRWKFVFLQKFLETRRQIPDWWCSISQARHLHDSSARLHNGSHVVSSSLQLQLSNEPRVLDGHLEKIPLADFLFFLKRNQ